MGNEASSKEKTKDLANYIRELRLLIESARKDSALAFKAISLPSIVLIAVISASGGGPFTGLPSGVLLIGLVTVITSMYAKYDNKARKTRRRKTKKGKTQS